MTSHSALLIAQIFASVDGWYCVVQDALSHIEDSVERVKGYQNMLPRAVHIDDMEHT